MGSLEEAFYCSSQENAKMSMVKFDVFLILPGILKSGNNGWVSCSTYCAGPQWGVPYDSCTAAWDDKGQRAMDCNTARGVDSPGVACYCDRQKGEGEGAAE